MSGVTVDSQKPSGTCHVWCHPRAGTSIALCGFCVKSTQALGYSAVRAGYTVRFSHADDFFKAMAQARVDNSVDRAFRSFLTPDLLILDDLGLHRLTPQQSADLYELILNRHRCSSFIITSNRAIEEWLSLFDDPILGNSARTARPTPATRSSSRAPATGNGCPHTVPCSATREVIDRHTIT